MEEEEEGDERALMFTLTSPGCRILELGIQPISPVSCGRLIRVC
jgi:hypothetical protein